MNQKQATTTKRVAFIFRPPDVEFVAIGAETKRARQAELAAPLFKPGGRFG
jgi:hypothetical protein